jgi:hypothetical protein
MFTPMGMHISTPTSIRIKTKNTAMSILTPTIMNTTTSTFTNILTREHQMFTIMSIKMNTVLTIIHTLDIRQKPINISMRRLSLKAACHI